MSLQELAKELFKRQLTQERVRGRKRWRPSGPGFVQSEVLPELIGAGLIVDTGGRLFDATWRLTDEGDEALVTLGRVLTFAREDLVPMIATDPNQAFRFVERYGTALLLARGLPEALRRLESCATTAGQGQSVSSTPDLPTIGTSHLARHFGVYNVDQLFHVVGSEVDLAWSDLRRGWLFTVGGE
jgi:hypothetical protein